MIPSDLTEIEFITGSVEFGCSDFTVRLGAQRWHCRASYISYHPLRDLILSAVDLYDHIFNSPIPVENAVWEICAHDEPGGIVVRAVPCGEQVNIRIYHYTGDKLWPNPKNTPEVGPVAESLVNYWQFAEAILTDAARSLANHGITGFRNAWEPHRWDIDAHWEVLPVEHFLYLATLVKHRVPIYAMTLTEEIALLSEIMEKYGGHSVAPL